MGREKVADSHRQRGASAGTVVDRLATKCWLGDASTRTTERSSRPDSWVAAKQPKTVAHNPRTDEPQQRVGSSESAIEKIGFCVLG
jgi:hypothetical protein